MTVTSTQSQTLLLPDGRKLGYAVYGTVISPAHHVLYFHGLQASRLEAAELDAPAVQLGIQIISIDRPGTGLSSPDWQRKITDWPADVSDLVDHLQMASFSILAVSGGAPYALACAKAMDAEQLSGVSIVAGVAPAWELGTYGLRNKLRFSTFLAQWLPISTLSKPLDQQYGLAARDSDPTVLEKIVSNGLVGLDEVSAGIYARDGAVQRSVDCIREAYKQGSEAVALEMKLVSCDWGFNLADVHFERDIRMYIGTGDCNMPLKMAREVQQRLPNPSLIEYEGESHFSVLPLHGLEILQELVGYA